MRVGLFGNICNNLYQLGRALRAHTSIDARLFVDVNSDMQEQPESDDPLLGRNAPWIHRARYLGPAEFLFPWRARIVKELAACDLAIVSSVGPMFSQFTGRPSIFFTTGGDVTVLPFPALWFDYFSLRERVGNLYTAIWQRRGIRRAQQIWTQPFAPYQEGLRRMHVARERISDAYFPVIIDTDKFQERNEPPSGAAALMRAKFDFAVFHPSRIMMEDGPAYRRTGQWKNNGVLFEAMARFLANEPGARAGLVMIDRPDNLQTDAARTMLRGLGIEDRVLWLEPPRRGGFTRDELVALYNAADVVADDFGAGWFGSVVLEGLAVARPVLCYVDEEVMARLYPSHPILSSPTAEGNAALLAKLFRDAEFRRQCGRSGRAWVERYHAPDAASRTYVEHFRRIVGGE